MIRPGVLFLVVCSPFGLACSGGYGPQPTGAGGLTWGPGVGSAGTTGTGGGPADCQACVVCANTNCANQVAACRANTGCNMIYQCAANCTSSIQTCVENNISGAQTFLSSVGPCISSNCAAQCMQ